MRNNCSVGLCLVIFLLIAPFLSNAEYANSNPLEACGFMDAMGMNTEGYKNPDNSGYFCLSPYKEFGTGFLKNNISYYAEGTAQKVTKLQLLLHVNVKKEAKQAHAELANSADALLKKALNASLPQKVKEAIVAGSNGKWKIGNANILITREDRPKGYDITFIIE